MKQRKGDEDMSVLAVPCDSAIILTKEQGESMLKGIKEVNISREEQKQLLERAKQLRRKPDKKNDE